MPRLPTGIYEQPFPDVVPDTTIESAVYNGFVNDVETDLNAARPIIAGGTGASSADEALKNVSAEKAAQLVASYDSHLWFPGSFRSAAAAPGAPNATSSFVGTAYINEALANPPTNANVVIEARDQNDTTIPGRTYVREKKAGTWGAWTGGIYAAPFDAMAYSGMQINGAMSVSQENGDTTKAGNVYICDGWRISSSGAMVMNTSRVSTVWLPGIPHFVGIAVGTAVSSLAAGDFALFESQIEGYRIARLGWGAAGAQPITLAFWTAHSRTGTFTGTIRNIPVSRSYAFTYTQNVAGIWEYKTVTIPGDTIGTWAVNNACGLAVVFSVACGATYTAPSTNTWLSGNYVAASGQVNNVATTSDNSRFAGVVILPGTQAPTTAQSPLIMRPYGEELITCKRYFQIVGPGLSGVAGGADHVRVIGSWLPLRTSPTASLSGAVNIDDDYTSNFTQSVASITIDHVSADNQYGGGRVNLSNFAGLVMGRMYSVTQVGGQVKLDARL